jgi:hypothetical protein
MMPIGPDKVLPDAGEGAPVASTGETPPPRALAVAPADRDSHGYRWYHKAAALALSAFCMAIGIFLVVYPWTDSWSQNYFAVFVPEWHQYWDNLYLRGAVSGLGLVNFYIALAEALRLRRFARH